MELKLSAGQFLAHDLGIRIDLTRTFSNGIRMGLWQTWTNGNDRLNGQIYYDKGLSISIPVDFFKTCSGKTSWSYSIGAWLRDVGQSACTGDSLLSITSALKK